ncbi:MAG: hypothetical protein Q7S56_03815 [Nanoarchaeota archaeon]|nr:hypothetical protein [Nanoarchaeota archaeon]
MEKNEIIDKIMEKTNYSGLVRSDVEKIYDKFSSKYKDEEDIIKEVRNFLRVNYSGFSGKKLFKWTDKEADDILKKHLSTRERFNFYEEVYSRLLKNLPDKFSIIDLGAGVNGFSYSYLTNVPPTNPLPSTQTSLNKKSEIEISSKIKKRGDKNSERKVNYLGIEAVGQLVDLMNNYFSSNKVKEAEAVHASLFELDKVKKLILKMKQPRVVFMLKVVDALEKVERDYTKSFLKEIILLVDRVVISFATESWFKRKKFYVNRNWLIDFIKESGWQFKDDFNLGGERYLIVEKS